MIDPWYLYGPRTFLELSYEKILYYRWTDRTIKKKELLFENENQARVILKKENYYNVINGYKDLFIEEQKDDEKFKKGVTFEEIYSLYEFDREIRIIFLKYILLWKII